MSCSEGTGGIERFPGRGCCGSSCGTETTGCSASERRIRSCFCQNNVGCLDRTDCGGFRPTGTAATGACPGPCQCAEEEVWNSNVPPKPNCEWVNNFSELRRQWSDHGRQQNCKCCNCKPRRSAAQCRPCLPPTSRCSSTSLPPSECQECCERRLAGGANDKREQTSTETATTNEVPLKREAGGGSSPTGCSHTARHRSPSTDCSSSSSSCCPTLTQSTNPSGSSRYHQTCAASPRSILKKRTCCQCTPGYCMCQPLPRNCHCPPPVQVDARAERDCSCDCPSSPECACPPSERRFPKTHIKCPNARMCPPMTRLPPGPKCRCIKCKPCLPPSCDPCTSTRCQTVLPKTRPCPPDYSSSTSRRPCSPSPETLRSCRPASPCYACNAAKPRTGCASCEDPGAVANSEWHKLTRPSSPACRGKGVTDAASETSSVYAQTCGNGRKTGSCSVFSYLGSIGHSTLVPGPLALLSFVLLVLAAVGFSSGVALYRHYAFPKKVCWNHPGR